MNYIKRLLEINQNTLLSDSSIFITVRLSRVIEQSFWVYSPFNQICPGFTRKKSFINQIHFCDFRNYLISNADSAFSAVYRSALMIPDAIPPLHSPHVRNRIPTMKLKIPGKAWENQDTELLLHSSYSF